MARRPVPAETARRVMTEAGYRCAVPTCRGVIAIDMHHLIEVSEGGGDELSNLIALCPTCHALHHRGNISRDSLYAYKAMLVALSAAFDVPTIDKLLFLSICERDALIVSGDGLLGFSGLIVSGYASAQMKGNNNFQLVTYAVNITEKGRLLATAWRSGDRAAVQQQIGQPAA